MKNRTSGVGIIILLVIIVIFIFAAISNSEPKCSLSGCDKDAIEGSDYCYLHEFSYQTYGNPDYNEVYEDSKNRRTDTTTTTDSSETNSESDDSVIDNSANNSNSNDEMTDSSANNDNTSDSSTSGSSSSSSKKTYGSLDAYDEGYEDVYFDEDYDWDRYFEDSDYASGVDDAMEDMEW